MVLMHQQNFFNGALLETHLAELSKQQQELGSLRETKTHIIYCAKC